MYKNKRIIAIIQARMESERLPGKVLLDLAGKSVLERIIERVNKSCYVDKIAIAIPDTKDNKRIVEEWRDKNWGDLCSLFKGSMDNVILRVLNTAQKIKIDWNTPDIIVDITADCPLVDYFHIDLLIEKLIDGKYDYFSNVVKRTWPDGCDIQVYKLETLASVYLKIKNELHRSHVGWNIIQFPKDYKIGNYPAPKKYNYPDMRLTLDTKKDYEVLNTIFQIIEDLDYFRIEKAIEILLLYPQIRKINESILPKIPGEG